MYIIIYIITHITTYIQKQINSERYKKFLWNRYSFFKNVMILELVFLTQDLPFPNVQPLTLCLALISVWHFALGFFTCIVFHLLRLDLSHLLFLCCVSPFLVSFPCPLPLLSRFCIDFLIDFCLVYFILLIPYLELPVFFHTSFLLPHTLPLLSYLHFLSPGFTCLALSIINDLNF